MNAAGPPPVGGDACSAERQPGEHRRGEAPTEQRRLGRGRHELPEQALAGAQLDEPEVAAAEAGAGGEVAGRDDDFAAAVA